MKLERAVLREVRLALKAPFAASHGQVHERRVLLLTLHAEGLEGWGECVALSEPTYTSETADTAWELLTSLALPSAIGRRVGPPPKPAVELLGPVREVRDQPMALATLEMAAWDLRARCEGASLATLLGGVRDTVPAGIALGLTPSVEALAEMVGQALEEGYARVKLKIAPGRDVDVLTRIRERFPTAALGADANGAYALSDAARLKQLDALELQWIEQPLAHDDLLGHARLQEEVTTPICLDESISSERDAAIALELGSCRVVNLKPGRVGGYAASIRIHDLLRAAGVPIWCGGMLETGIGRAHNLALASLPGFTMPGDISASRRYWERDLVIPEHVLENGHVRVPTGHGIGVEVDAEWIEELTVRTAAFG